mgnify:FL=1
MLLFCIQDSSRIEYRQYREDDVYCNNMPHLHKAEKCKQSEQYFRNDNDHHILYRCTVRSAADTDSISKASQIMRHNQHIGTLRCIARTGSAHRDTDIRSLQLIQIMNAIANVPAVMQQLFR